MFRPSARLTLLIVALTTAALAVICAGRYDPGITERFFAHSCQPMPCWQGIRPGVTTDEQALAILRAHPWVESVSEGLAASFDASAPTVVIYWRWSSAYPFADDDPPPQQGFAITDHGIVRQIYLTTRISFGDLWLALGDADGGAVDYLYDTHHLRMENTALFAQAGVAATGSLITDCGDTYPNFWSAPVTLWLQNNAPLGRGSADFPVYLHLLRTGYRSIWKSFC